MIETRRLIIYLITTLAALAATVAVCQAAPGGSGFFGGISEGGRLAKTTAPAEEKKNAAVISAYKEIIFLDGEPRSFSGLLTVKPSGGVTSAASGTYKITYTVAADGDDDANISRSLVLTVNWRREGSQVIRGFTVSSWKETATAGDKTYTVMPKLSHFDVSSLTDETPGVDYWKADVSARIVYRSGSEDSTVDMSGSYYGYDCAWSSAEAGRLSCRLQGPAAAISYQLRPSVSSSKKIDWSANEPRAISFAGNYRELFSGVSSLRYTLLDKPAALFALPNEGGVNIDVYSEFEQLPAPDLSFLTGHAAESDISKLFALGVLDGDPKHYVPSQAITRALYTTMLVKAIKLPVEQPAAKTSARAKKSPADQPVFPDVTLERPDYPYIMAAYKAGLAVGRGSGRFYADYAISREEAIAIAVRALGLSGVAPASAPLTPFADDADISDWAKREIYAAYRIGLTAPDADGRLNPAASLTKAEAAALVGAMIDYMRGALAEDYGERIVSYTERL
ncbi:MAG: S-layer homology domain-containing protein [Clostridiales bacterium]|jgi:hypothetical protein|nr:S-layer homology domain-containing protein [Clostridiales bacterium]